MRSILSIVSRAEIVEDFVLLLYVMRNKNIADYEKVAFLKMYII